MLMCATRKQGYAVRQQRRKYPHLTDSFISRLHADVKTLLAVAIVRFGQDVVDVVKHITLVQELMIRLLEFKTPTSIDKAKQT